MTIEQTNRGGCGNWFVRDGRLRSGWRVALYFVLARFVQIAFSIAVGIAIGILLAVMFAGQGVVADELGNRIAAVFTDISRYPGITLLFQALNLLLILATIYVFRRWIDKRSFSSLGFQRTPGWWQEFFAGFAFGLIGWSSIFVIAVALGAATITGFAWDGGDWLGVLGMLATGLVLNLMVGLAEEIDFRGYILQNLSEGMRGWLAVLISSILFAVMHIFNPGAGLVSTLGIVFAGILLAAGYYATKRLWFPIAMHAAWNFAEGPLFGFSVSGLDMGGLFHLKLNGPDWLIGGTFGPEAGVLAITVEFAMVVVLWAWAKRKSGQA